jgi:WD40 repeat protein
MNYQIPRPSALRAIAAVLCLGVLGASAASEDGIRPSLDDGLPTEIVPSVTGGISQPAFSPNGEFMAFGNGNGGQLWDIKKDRLVRTYSGLKSISTAIAISPDGARLAAGAGGILNVWNVRSGAIEVTLDLGMSSVNAIFFSSDGRRLIYGGSPDNRSNQAMLIRDIDSGRVIKGAVGHSTQALDVSQDGRFIATGDIAGSTRLFNSEGQLVRELAGDRSTSQRVDAIAFSPDGKFLASGEGGGSVKIWDVASGRQIRTLSGHDPNYINAISWSPDGTTVATSDSKALRIYNSRSGALEAKKNYEQMKFIDHVKYMPDGHTIFVGGMLVDAKSLDFLRWKAVGPGIINEFARGLSTKEDQVIIPGGDTGSLYSMNVMTGVSQEIAAPITGAGSWAYVVASQDGKRFAAIRDDSLLFMDVAAKGSVKVLQSGLKEAYTSAISPNGKLAAVGTRGALTIFDTDTGSVVQRLKGDDPNYSADKLVFSPDSASLLAAWIGNTVRIWRVSSGTSSAQFKLRTSNGNFSFAPDGLSFLIPGTASDEYKIDLWSVIGPKLIKRLGLPNADHMVSAVDMHQNQQLIAAGGFDGMVRVWNMNSGSVVQSLKGHIGPISGVKFVAGGTRLVSSAIGGLKIWDPNTGASLASHLLASNGEWITITPEGFFDASSPKAAQNLSIVRGLEVSSIDQVYNALYRPDLVREKLAGDPDGKVKAAAAKLDLYKVMASGAGPKVAIISPAAGSSSSIDEVTAEATVSDQGGGIGKVEWRVNGVTSGVETRGLERVQATGASTGRSLTVKRTLALERGENRIEVLAYNNKDLIASEPASVTVNWDGEKAATPPKLYVLAVGVNDYYDSRLRLSYAVPDATAIAEGFRKAGTGLYAAVDVRTVLDTDVTIANLDKVFAELATKAQPRDVFVFFLAGHGKTKNGRYYFLPRDFRYDDEDSIEKAGMGQDKFQAWFSEIPARKSILLYDTCESGSLTGTKARGSDIDERLGALNRMTRATGRTFLTATTDDAPALEGYHGHGVFTFALLDALDHADVNKNGLIEVSELADYIDQKVPDISFEAFKMRQIPQRNIVGNNFALTNKTLVLDAVNGIGNGELTSTPKSVSAVGGSQSLKKATHIVVTSTPIEVFESVNIDGTKGAVVDRLPIGTLVMVVKSSNGWDLIASEGKSLGYVTHAGLAPVQ